MKTKRDEDEGMGVICEILTSGRYQVELKSGRKVMCYVSGMARKDKSRLAVGNRVRVELEGYHGKKGRITYRYRDIAPTDEDTTESVEGIEPETNPES